MKYLIVNADDLGLSVSKNLAVGRAFREGLVTSTSLMANMPALPHALEHVIRPNPELAVGIHLCLTSGRPVVPAWEVPLLVDARGCFRRGFLGLLRLLHSRQRGEALRQIERELGAQAECIRACGIEIDHVDSHHHVHMLPDIFPLAAAIARRHHAAIRMADERWGLLRLRLAGLVPCLLGGGPLKKVLLSRLAKAARRSEGVLCADHYAGVLFSGRMTRSVLWRLVQQLPDGITEINVHPGQADDDYFGRSLCCSRADQRDLRSPYRAAELTALLDPSLREHLARLDVALVRFGDVLPRPQTGRVRHYYPAAA